MIRKISHRIRVFNFTKLTALVLFSLIAVQCDTWEDDINKNPNNYTGDINSNGDSDNDAADPSTFMTSMLFDVVNSWDYIHWNVAAAVCEYHGKTKSLSQGNRHKSWHALEYVWDSSYGAFRHILNVRNAALSSNDDRYVAIANIWQCYNIACLTNLYGDVPYSETIIEDPPIRPKYDKQEDIYASMIELLLSSGEMINSNDAPVNAETDLIFGGDMLKWKKFANTLLIRYAMYMSDANPEAAKEILNTILNDPGNYPIMESNDDNALFHYDPVYRPSPTYSLSKTKIEEAPFSNVFIERMISLKDPRLPIMARPVQNVHTDANCNVLPSNSGTDKYVGHLYGISTDNAHSVIWNNGPSYASYLGTFYRTEDSNGDATIESASVPTAIALYSEMLFFLAEAAQKGWITGNAEDYYNKAVSASFEHYNAVFSSDKYNRAYGSQGLSSIDEYLAQNDVNLSGGRNPLVLIAEQKWLASFLLMFEPYFDHRRTMLPKLRASSGAESFASSGSGNKFPSRAAYPDSEVTSNRDNVEEARANGFDMAIINDETRNEALMWLLQSKDQEWLRMPEFQEPAYKEEFPCVEGEAEYGTAFKAWYDANWSSMFWWENNDN